MKPRRGAPLIGQKPRVQMAAWVDADTRRLVVLWAWLSMKSHGVVLDRLVEFGRTRGFKPEKPLPESKPTKRT